MADQVKDRAPDDRDDGDVPKTRPPERPDRAPEAGAESSERRRAETEIAAGDVADDLADFA